MIDHDRAAYALHRTPRHRNLLAAASDGYLSWRPVAGRSGSFVSRDGGTVGPSADLVALYELCAAGLIAVDRPAGTVSITSVGQVKLAEWLTPAWLRPAS